MAKMKIIIEDGILRNSILSYAQDKFPSFEVSNIIFHKKRNGTVFAEAELDEKPISRGGSASPPPSTPPSSKEI